jgi:hypothetical protein
METALQRYICSWAGAEIGGLIKIVIDSVVRKGKPFPIAGLPDLDLRLKAQNIAFRTFIGGFEDAVAAESNDPGRRREIAGRRKLQGVRRLGGTSGHAERRK